jgi:acid phosphatase family membrane protein YuiD
VTSRERLNGLLLNLVLETSAEIVGTLPVLVEIGQQRLHEHMRAFVGGRPSGQVAISSLLSTVVAVLTGQGSNSV